MKRRGFLQTLACAVAASAMEVTGWAGVAPKPEPDYSFAAQIEALRKNFMDNIFDVWDDRDQHERAIQSMLPS